MRARLSVILAVALSLAFVIDGAYAKRTSKDVKRDKQKTEKQIARTRKQIEENDRETSRQLSRLQTISAEIALYNDTIAILSERLDSVDTAITALNDSIEMLEARANSVKDNYARTLRSIRSRRQGMSDLAFVFSAKSFGQAWRRMRSLREVAKTSTKQARQLAAAREDVEKARVSLEDLRAVRAHDLARQKAIQTTLLTEQASADNLVKNLKRQGKSLQRELDRRNKQAQSLDSELDKIVEEEIRQAEERRRAEAEAKVKAEAEARAKAEAEAKAKAEAEAKAKVEANNKAKAQSQGKDKPKTAPAKKEENTQPKTPVTGPQPTPPVKETPKENKKQPQSFESEAEKDRRLSGSFVSNKGKLLFPVAGKYTIVSKFGTTELPELSKVKVDNLGIDIEVPKGASARSVFEGVVSSIFRLDGYNNIVIVRHGEYLSVYAGIEALAVRKGDKVTAGQSLGTIHSPQNDGRSRLHFEIRHEKEKLNPSEWVR